MELMMQETICLQCGDKGFTNAFVYCVKCLNFAVHRYCLASIPATFDELVHWVCGDDCEGEAQNQSSISNHDIIPSHTRDLIVVREDEHVPTNVDLIDYDDSANDHAIIALHSEDESKVDYDESANDHAIIALHSEDESKICPASLPVQIDDKENNDKLMQPMRLIIKGFPKTLKKKRRRKMKSSKEKKDEHTLDDDLKSFNEETKEEVRVKDDNSSKQRDRKRASSNSSKKKKKKNRKISFPSEENLLEGKPEDEKSYEENKCSLSKDNVKNGELEDINKKTIEDIPENLHISTAVPVAIEDINKKAIEDIPENLHISTAVPIAMPIWTGVFDIMNDHRVMLNGILAHVSILACAKVYDEVLQFRPVLQLQMLPKNDVWPKSFETLEPRGNNIALYFFPSKSSEQDFDCLVDEMMRNELALKATVQNAELLIFNSSELPLLYWKFQNKYYLWGVFRQKQGSLSNSHPCRDEAKVENLIRLNEMDKTSLAKTGCNGLSPHSPLSNSASNGSHT